MDRFYEYYQVENIARDRIAANREEIAHSILEIGRGNPLAAERDEQRRAAGIQRATQLPASSARAISEAISARSAAESAAPAGARPRSGPEAIQGPAVEFLDVAFFDRGRRAANCVARVATPFGRAIGSGSIVAPGLFLTNAHVIPSPEEAQRFVIEVDMERDALGATRQVTRFRLAPQSCFVVSGVDALDFTLVAIGGRIDGERELAAYGFIPLLDAGDKHMLGEVANIIQHPEGRLKEVVLHENRLVARDNTSRVLHYVADTQPGSSGSPVFNNQWEMIALHHWAGPFREVVGLDGLPLMQAINEGVRVSAIVRALETRDAAFEGGSEAPVARALEIWDSLESGGVRSAIGGESAPLIVGAANREGAGFAAPAQGPTDPGGPARVLEADGSTSWIVPVRINISIPGAGGTSAPPAGVMSGAGSEAASWREEDFSDRAGYEPGFLHGHVVPLPVLKAVPGRAARNILALASDPDPEEFRYHHFSVKLNAERGLCYFTAANIDGARLKRVDRDSGAVKDDPTLADFRAEGLTMDRFKKGAAFMPDRRVKPGELMTQHFYESQKIEGVTFADNRREFMARMYQRGHIVLRGDIGWGTHDEALAADRDSYFFTNICPQVGAFNMGVSPDGSGDGKLHWREVETYVLRNALVDRQRVSVFAGPVFSDTDLPYRFGSFVPLKFWKIALWSDAGTLRSVALIADQSPLIEIRPEALGPEGFTDPAEIARMQSFLSTVVEIEALTGLDFGDPVRSGDIRGDSAAAVVAGFDRKILGVSARRPRKPRVPKASRPQKAKA